LADPPLATLSGVNIKRVATDRRQSQGGHTGQQNERQRPYPASLSHFPERTDHNTPQNVQKTDPRKSQYLTLE
jgi:hypothetical protein